LLFDDLLYLLSLVLFANFFAESQFSLVLFANLFVFLLFDDLLSLVLFA